MLKLVILVCAVGIPQQDCSRQNAIDVIRYSEPVSMPQQCGFLGQALLAQSSLAPSAKSYMKVLCERQEIAAK